jgi:molybdopterin synthase sulfur carrier subunit
MAEKMESMMNIMVFGQLADITGATNVLIRKSADTDLLLTELFNRFPLLKEKKFLVAVDRKIITEKTQISEQAVIALLPPFSGG